MKKNSKFNLIIVSLIILLFIVPLTSCDTKDEAPGSKQMTLENILEKNQKNKKV